MCPYDVYQFPSAVQLNDVILRPIPPRVPETYPYSISLPIRYIKMYTLVKRNGKVVARRKSFTPFVIERAIQP